MQDGRFSYYRPPVNRSITPTQTLTLEEIWQTITTDKKLQEATSTLRGLALSDGEETYRKQKGELLPSVTFGGVFDYRSSDSARLREKGKKGLLSASGLLIVDIDHLSELGLSLEGLRSQFAKDRELGARLIFVSPSGDGLKLVCKTDTEITDDNTYKEVYYSLKHYIESTYSHPGREIVDGSGKDITRLCYVPYDSEAIFLRDSEDTFHPERHPVPTGQTTEDYTDLLREFEGLPSLGAGIEILVRRVENSGRDLFPHYHNYFALACSLASLGEYGRPLFKRVCSLHTPPPTELEMDTEFDKGLKHSGWNAGYFVNACKEAGIDTSLRRPQDRYTPSHRRQTYQAPLQETPQEEISDEEKFKDYLQIQDLRELASRKKEGIKTGYLFTSTDKKKTEELILPSGALSLICGRSSHGKTRLLQNLALHIAEEEHDSKGDGVVLYFSFEEGLLEVAERIANIEINIDHLSQYEKTKNTDVLLDYFKEGELRKAPEANRATALPRLKKFESMYQEGRLRLFYSPDLYSDDLCKLLRLLSSQSKVRAIFLDYVQAIYKENYHKDRREELREICRDLNKVAIDLDIPIVLTAQLNRESPSPTEMSGDNIAESADITRYANTILLLWDSAKTRDYRGGVEAYTNTQEGKRLKEMGFDPGVSGKLYAVITKNRGGSPDIEAVLDYKPETGAVPSNITPFDEDTQSFDPGSRIIFDE